MSDDTTKLLPVHDAGDDATTVLPSTPAHAQGDDKTRVMPVDADTAHDADTTTVMPTADAASHESDETAVLPAAPGPDEDGTVTLPAVTPVIPADTEVMAPAIEVRSQEAEDAQATQALEQIPSDLDDFAEPAADVRSDAEPVAQTTAPTTDERADEVPSEPGMDTASAIDGATPSATTGETSGPTDASTANPLLDQPIMNAAYGAVPPVSGPMAPPAPDVRTGPAAPIAQPEPPKGASAPTIAFGLLGILLGVIGLFVGLDMDLIGDWLVALTPQTVIAVLCAGVGAILLVVALIWGVVKAVARPKSGSAAGVE